MKSILLLLALCSTLAHSKYTILTNDIAIGDNIKPEIGLAFSVQTTDKSAIPCPKMTGVERDALGMAPVGACVYNLDTLTYQVFDGASWADFGGAGGGLTKWVTLTTYPIDAVIYDEISNKIYKATTAHMAGATFAGDIANWQELSERGFDKWRTGTIYPLDMAVYDDLTDRIYKCITAHTSGATFAGDIAVWQELSVGPFSADEAQAAKNSVSTGILTGGAISIGAPTTTINIAAGVGYVVDNTTDPENPVITKVAFGPFVNVPITNIGSTIFTILSIDSSGSLVQRNTQITPTIHRSEIVLGAVSHLAMTAIESVVNITIPMADVGVSINGLASAIGIINLSGNVYSGNGATLQLQKNSGMIFEYGSNFVNDPTDPHRHLEPLQQPVTSIVYSYRDGIGGHVLAPSVTVVEPDLFDDGSGTLAAVPNNRYSIQRMYYRPIVGLTNVVYGTDTYPTLAAAEGAIQGEDTDVFALVESGALFRGWMLIHKGTTSLINAADVKFIAAGKFGEGPAGGVSTSTTSLQQAYENSFQPQITLNATLGGMQILDAATPIAAPLFQVMDFGSLTEYFSVSAGVVTVEGALVVVSTTDGSQPAPKMTEIQRDAIIGAVTGDMVYNLDTDAYNHFDGSVWTELGGSSALALLSKASIITSDGVTNGEFTACADGDRIEWDSSETSGIKCITPSAGGPTYEESASSGSYVSPCQMSVTITTTGGPVELMGVPANNSVGNFAGFGGSGMDLYRDAVKIQDTVSMGSSVGLSITAIDTPSAGTHTYKMDLYNCQYMKLVAKTF